MNTLDAPSPATAPALAPAPAPDLALTKKQRESADWWTEFFARRQFPQRGQFFLVPGGELGLGHAVILHVHSGRKYDFRFDPGETWRQSQQVFAAALPRADEVSFPDGIDPDSAPLPNVTARHEHAPTAATFTP